jgi:hypothetical protein
MLVVVNLRWLLLLTWQWRLSSCRNEGLRVLGEAGAVDLGRLLDTKGLLIENGWRNWYLSLWLLLLDAYQLLLDGVEVWHLLLLTHVCHSYVGGALSLLGNPLLLLLWLRRPLLVLISKHLLCSNCGVLLHLLEQGLLLILLVLVLLLLREESICLTKSWILCIDVVLFVGCHLTLLV